MQRYHHADVSFDVPADWQDRSVTVFVAPPEPGQKVEASVVVTREQVDGDESVRRYADHQIVVLAKQLEDFCLLARIETTLGGRPAAVVLYSWQSGQDVLRQRVVFVRGGQTMLTFTATAAQDQFLAVAPTFHAILESVRFPDADGPASAPDRPDPTWAW
jgi:hypothetical protein